LTHNPEIGEGVTLVVVTVAALAFGLLRLIFSSFELSIFYFYDIDLSISNVSCQKNPLNVHC
jgi:hypothetical protein